MLGGLLLSCGLCCLHTCMTRRFRWLRCCAKTAKQAAAEYRYGYDVKPMRADDQPTGVLSGFNRDLGRGSTPTNNWGGNRYMSEDA